MKLNWDNLTKDERRQGVIMTEGKRKGKEQGAGFQIKCILEIIKGKESRGEDATFERDLLKSWSRHEGYEGAKQALASCGKPNG